MLKFVLEAETWQPNPNWNIHHEDSMPSALISDTCCAACIYGGGSRKCQQSASAGFCWKAKYCIVLSPY